MGNSYSDLIRNLEGSAETLRAQGTKIGALDAAIAELKRHTENIEAVERDIDAVRDEVIAPIKVTLDENKLAGRFSIFGFWVGLLSIVISTGGLIYTVYESRLQRHIGEYTVTSDILVSDGYSELLTSGTASIVARIDSGGITEDVSSGKPVPCADVTLVLRRTYSSSLGTADEVQILRHDGSQTVHAKVVSNLRVYTGDILTLLGKYSFKVVAIRPHQGGENAGVVLKSIGRL